MVQPVMLDGHVAGVMADIKERSPVVWEQGLPRRVPELGTRLLVQDPGRGPHNPGLDDATKRDKLTMPTGQLTGMVPVRALEPRISWFRAPKVLQADGRVPVRWLLEMVR